MVAPVQPNIAAAIESEETCQLRTVAIDSEIPGFLFDDSQNPSREFLQPAGINPGMWRYQSFCDARKSRPPVLATGAEDQMIGKLSVCQRNHLVEIAKTWLGTPYKYGESSHKMTDCSHLVANIYDQAGLKFPYTRSSDFCEAHPNFTRTSQPHNGDILVWDGHVAIVVDAENGLFIGAQNDGVSVESFHKGHWANPKPKIYTWQS